MWQSKTKVMLIFIKHSRILKIMSAVKSFDAFFGEKQLFQINTFSFTKVLNVDYLWHYTVLN